MRLARARIDLKEIGIREMRPRRARTGALLLEIPGAEGVRLADTLADKLRHALADNMVTRPQKTAEIRIRDLEDFGLRGRDSGGPGGERELLTGGGTGRSRTPGDQRPGDGLGEMSPHGRQRASEGWDPNPGMDQDEGGAVARSSPDMLPMLGKGAREGDVHKRGRSH